jgi:2-oxoglutarate ferredoxin oxidoreductase subunit delta
MTVQKYIIIGKYPNLFGILNTYSYLCTPKLSVNALNNYIMAKMKGAIVVDTERCKGCQLCIIACPQKVIALANKVNLHGYPYVKAVNEEACVGCASCGIVCPDGCITVYRVKQE